MNVKVDWQDQGGDPAAQRAIFDTFAANADKYDFVGVQPVSIGTLVEPITTLIQAGKPVVAIDTLIAPFKQQQDMGVFTFMSCDNIVLGEGVAMRSPIRSAARAKLRVLAAIPVTAAHKVVV